MAHIKVTDEDIKTLEAKARLAYNTLESAVGTTDQIQKIALLSSAECLYEHDLGCYLSNLTRQATHSFRHLNKGGKRARKIEAFILQYVLMRGQPRRETASYRMEINENPNDGMGGLKAFLDAKDSQDSEEGIMFRVIRDKSAQLRKEGRYDLILNALAYVKNNLKNHPSQTGWIPLEDHQTVPTPGGS